MVLEPEGTLKVRLQINFKDAPTKMNSLSMVTQLVNDRAGNMLGSISGINKLIDSSLYFQCRALSIIFLYFI